MKISDFVSKSNTLLEASYKLTLDEQRLIVSSLQTFDQKYEMPNKIRVYASDFAKTFGIDTKSSYGQVEEAASRLYERSIYTYEQTTGKREKKRWIITATYHDDEGFVEITYHNDVKPYLSQLKDKMTSYDPHRLASLSSSYSFRLFELLISHLAEGSVTYSVPLLREKLGVDETKYPKFGELRRNVIDKAVKDLNNNSELQVECSFNKRGRSVISIEFTIQDMIQRSLDF